MIDTLASVLQLRFKRMAVSRHGPNVLREFSTRLLADQPSLYPLPQQTPGFLYTKDTYIVAQGFIVTRCGWRIQSKVARMFLVYRVSALLHTLSKAD